MNPNTPQAIKLFMDGALAFARAEQYGMLIDVPYYEKQKEILSKKISTLENEFKQSKFYKHWEHAFHGKVNINSNPQLAAFLYKVKGIEPKVFTDKGHGATDEDALLKLNIPEIESLIQIRKFRKLKDTYIDGYLREHVDGIIHPFMNLHPVVSFRSSMDMPNGQNIPKRDKESMNLIRRGIIPRPGHLLLEADWSGAEIKTSVCIHKDPVMKKYVTDSTTDMHRDMAIQIFLLNKFDKAKEGHATLRQASKNGFVFPEFYGDWYKSCATYTASEWCKLPEGKWKPGQGIKFEDYFISDHLINNGIKSLDAFTDHLQIIEKDFWQRRFKVYNQWRNNTWEFYQRNGYVDLVTGFRCSGLMNKKQVGNYPIQGPSFHTLLWCFIKLDKLVRKHKMKSRLILQIHDSMLWDIYPPELNTIIDMIQNVLTIDLSKHWDWVSIPFTADFEGTDVNQSWATKHEFKIAT